MALIKCPECSTEVSENSANCVKCGYPIKDIIKCSECGTYNAGKPAACARCGAPLKPTAVAAAAAAPASPARYPASSGSDDDEFKQPLSDKWAWMLACAPMMGFVLEMIIYAAGGYNPAIGFIIMLGLNITFAVLDSNELKAKGYASEGWIWLAILIVPVYLFLRAAKTNKHYGYAITWCVLIFVYIMCVVAFVAAVIAELELYDFL